MNSEAISIATHSVIEPTALQICRCENSDCILAVMRSRSARGISAMAVSTLLVFMVSGCFAAAEAVSGTAAVFGNAILPSRPILLNLALFLREKH
jgi:hypothetical protein